jgi:hypothetical protein
MYSTKKGIKSETRKKKEEKLASILLIAAVISIIVNFPHNTLKVTPGMVAGGKNNIEVLATTKLFFPPHIRRLPSSLNSFQGRNEGPFPHSGLTIRVVCLEGELQRCRYSLITTALCDFTKTYNHVALDCF